jgi:hypothetical protein
VLLEQCGHPTDHLRREVAIRKGLYRHAQEIHGGPGPLGERDNPRPGCARREIRGVENPSDPRGPAAGRLRAHGHHRPGRAANDAVRDAPEEHPPQAGSAVGADHDEVAPFISGHLQDPQGGRALGDQVGSITHPNEPR